MLLADYEAERAVLGALLQHPSLIKALVVREGLRPEHFHRADHSQVLQALVALSDRGEHPDLITVRGELERTWPNGKAARTVAECALSVANLPGVPSYARRLISLHNRRRLKLAAQMLAAGAERDDATTVSEAVEMIATPVEAEPSTWSAGELAERYYERLESPAPDRWPWPFRELTAWTGGGLRRKQVVLIGGWTSNGKSCLYDQALDGFARAGLKVHSYINEMSEEERMDRTVSRLSGVRFAAVHARDLDEGQRARVLKALPEVRVGLTECAGWTAPEIARHIRFNRWDVAGIDILHEIAHREERDLAEIAQQLRAAAKQSNCALICCVHLNDNRITSPKRPTPVLRDVRGSGMLVRGADLVLFVHRDDDKDGVPGRKGTLFAAKVRNGQPAAMGVVFDPDRMRFLPAAREAAAA